MTCHVHSYILGFSFRISWKYVKTARFLATKTPSLFGTYSSVFLMIPNDAYFLYSFLTTWRRKIECPLLDRAILSGVRNSGIVPVFSSPGMQCSRSFFIELRTRIHRLLRLIFVWSLSAGCYFGVLLPQIITYRENAALFLQKEIPLSD